MLSRFYHSGGVDLVDLGDIRVFMICNDNLYTNFIPEISKRVNIQDHYRKQTLDSIVTMELLENTTDPKYSVYICLKHLLESDKSVNFFDIGCFVGDVGLQIAYFAKTHNLPIHVDLFDPTLSGQLVPYNITLNLLEDYTTFHNYAVSDYDGFALFNERPSHSDSSSLFQSSGGNATSIVPIVSLKSILDQDTSTFFLKLDTENQEARIIKHVYDKIRSSSNIICFEYHALDDAVTHLIADLVTSHYIFDIGYLPNPFTCCYMPERVEDLLKLRSDVAQRPFRYTDILAISRNIPNVDGLLNRLNSLNSKPISYNLA